MARGYTVATVALALDTPAKWVDNILSHYTIPRVAQSHQGVARRVSVDGVFVLSLVAKLAGALRVPLARAVEGAHFLAEDGRWTFAEGMTLTIDRDAAIAALLARLESAVEAAPVPRRGRPPGKAKRGA